MRRLVSWLRLALDNLGESETGQYTVDTTLGPALLAHMAMRTVADA